MPMRIAATMDRALAQDRAAGRDPLADGSDTQFASQVYSQLRTDRGIDADTAATLALTAIVWTAEDYDAYTYL